MRDLMNNLHVVNAIPPVAARTDNTAIVSSIIDLKGFNSLMFAISLGTNTDANATFAVWMEESNDSGMSGALTVVAPDIIGSNTLAGFDFADDTETRKIGYSGNSRYVRLKITPTGNDSGNIFVAAVAILGGALSKPTANPPQ
jgi:hypothetical protein